MPTFIRNLLLIMAIGFGLYALSKTSMAREIIKKLEGYSDVPYQDSAGYWTIGYGHKIVAGDRYYPLGPITRITETEANALLDRDMESARNTVLSYSRVPLSSAQIDALTSLVYNIGSGNFSGSTLLKKLNAGDFAGAANEFTKWNKAGGSTNAGLVARRDIEKQLFVS